MTLNRLLEITNDLERCAFCPGMDCECEHCDVSPVTKKELREFYQKIREVLTGNAKLKAENSRLWSEVDAAVNDMQRLVVFSADSCEVCAGPGDCEICRFQWRGLEECPMPDIDYDKLRAVRRLCNLRPPPERPQCPDERCVWLLDGQVCTFDRCVSPKRFEEGERIDHKGCREHKA